MTVAAVVPSDTVKVLVAVTAKELVAVRPETLPVVRAVVPVLASALRAVDWALATRLVRDEMLSLVDFRTLLAATTPSKMLLRSAARLLSADAAKNTVALSFAELTFLPVARRFCVVVSRSLVCCNE